MEIRGIDRPIVVIDGDGQVDLGLEDMATAFQQGYKYLHVVCDNQAHAASGSHATGSTHPLARTGVRPSGKLRHPKHFPLMLMYSGAAYVATASTSHPQDLDRKLRNAMSRLPAYIQILTPCNPSWGYDDDKGIEVSPLGGQLRHVAVVRVERRRVPAAANPPEEHGRRVRGVATAVRSLGGRRYPAHGRVRFRTWTTCSESWSAAQLHNLIL